VRALLSELGDPQKGLRGALVAGTNGKGSTCAFLESILRAAGLRTGMMPKPHLSSYTERIQVDGEPIPEADFAAAVSEIRPAVARVGARLGAPTEFEILTALAIAHLAPRIDVLVCEVGMGGRLDATNVLELGVAVLTNVALDHQRYLGETIEKIAAEKAAIIKPGDRVVSGCEDPARAVLESAATGAGAAVWQLGQDVVAEGRPAGWEGSVATITVAGREYRDLAVPLLGPWQVTNAALAVAAATALDVDGAAVAAGVAATRWPGRLEVIGEGPAVVLDGGHNPAALDRVVPYLAELLAGRPVALVFGAMEDKDLASMLTRLRGLAPAIAVFTRARSAVPRAAAPADLALYWGAGAMAVEDSAAALEIARQAAGAGGVVLACGSLYLVGELRDLLLGVA
jgi:dihydrofolate synthase/folylpolyglutamate synthase